VYIPEQELCVKQAMIRWRDSTAANACMKNLRTNWDLRHHYLCESKSGNFRRHTALILFEHVKQLATLKE
jgi:hypothetical protein